MSTGEVREWSSAALQLWGSRMGLAASSQATPPLCHEASCAFWAQRASLRKHARQLGSLASDSVIVI